MSRTIDPYNALPKYNQLASILRQKIEDGEWPPRTPIPSERQLEVIYNISRTTIREAIDHLVRQGYLYREHGRGTFVSPQKLQKGLMELTSFSEDLLKRGIQPGQIIRAMDWIEAPAKIAQKLEVPTGTACCVLSASASGMRYPSDCKLPIWRSLKARRSAKPSCVQAVPSTACCRRS
jgi:DNA-binding GntR family transcriptional regulator